LTIPIYVQRQVTGSSFSIGKYICTGEHCISFTHIIYGLLCCLWCLHLNWFFRAVKVLIQTLKNDGNVQGDTRYEKAEKAKQEK
jgi:hypothetical protein